MALGAAFTNMAHVQGRLAELGARGLTLRPLVNTREEIDRMFDIIAEGLEVLSADDG